MSEIPVKQLLIFPSGIYHHLDYNMQALQVKRHCKHLVQPFLKRQRACQSSAALPMVHAAVLSNA